MKDTSYKSLGQFLLLKKNNKYIFFKKFWFFKCQFRFSKIRNFKFKQHIFITNNHLKKRLLQKMCKKIWFSLFWRVFYFLEGFFGKTFFGFILSLRYIAIFVISVKLRIFWHPVLPIQRKENFTNFFQIVGFCRCTDGLF